MAEALQQGHLETLGLWGDGDELDALRNVEERFGVELDHTGAGTWFTAGDVYADLLKTLPEEAAKKPHTWTGFAEAISQETGVDPLAVTPQTRLIHRTGSRRLSFVGGRSHRAGWTRDRFLAISAAALNRRRT
jgi:hypothetical protein